MVFVDICRLWAMFMFMLYCSIGIVTGVLQMSTNKPTDILFFVVFVFVEFHLCIR